MNLNISTAVVDFSAARFNMLRGQLRPCEVTDENVLNIIDTVPREKFVPDAYQDFAFADTQIPLGGQSVMMKPLQEASMLQALAIKPTDRILEVGTGSGFMTACLAKMGEAVVSYEMNADLSQQAEQRLQSLDIQNVQLVVGNIFEAKLASKSYDVIAVTGSVPHGVQLPEDSLALGGRMFFVKGEPPVMSAMLLTRDQAGTLNQEAVFETLVPPLEKIPSTERFVF